MTQLPTLTLTTAHRRIDDPGLLALSGSDRIDFLQRMSTNDLRGLHEGQVVTTVLTSAAARILDVLQVFVQDDATLGVLTLPGRAIHTAAFLKGKIFFNDDVRIEDRSATISLTDVYFPLGAELAGLPAHPDEGQVVRSDDTLLIGQPSLGGLRCVRVLTTTDGDPTGGTPAFDESDFDALRIATGRPAHGNELTEDYTPLEVGLRETIAMDKGCYTGQEVIARQINYDKITRQMVPIALDAPAAVGDSVEVGGKRVGEITSVAVHPELGPIALGVLKRPHFEPGTALTAGQATGHVLAPKMDSAAG